MQAIRDSQGGLDLSNPRQDQYSTIPGEVEPIRYIHVAVVIATCELLHDILYSLRLAPVCLMLDRGGDTFRETKWDRQNMGPPEVMRMQTKKHQGTNQ